MKSQKGFITLDFLFAVILIWGFTMILLRMSLTLTTASVVQYITFASARNYFAAHSDPSVQVQMAERKYTELLQHPVFRPMFANNWFEVLEKPDIGDISKIKPGFSPGENNKFWGVGTTFVAKLLDFKLPYFGSSDPEGDGEGGGFETYISSFMGREPTSSECWQFTQERFKAIRALDTKGAASYSTGSSLNAYNPVEDSGC